MSRRTITAILVIATVVGVFEVYFLTRKFPVYQPAAYNRYPRLEIDRVGSTRVGIVLSHHGASFVRLPPNTGATGTIPPDVVSDMRQSLRSLPLKFAAEYFLYLAVVCFVWFGLIAACKHLRKIAVRTIAVGGVLACATLFLQLPVFWGYDSTVFSNWVGPGALSYSRPHAEITFIPGVSIAQRFVLEAIHTGVLQLLAPPSRWLSYIDVALPTPETWLGACLLAALLYGGIGMMVALPASLVLRRPEAGT